MSATDTQEPQVHDALAASAPVVQAALLKLHDALMQSILLAQHPGIQSQPLHAAAQKEGVVQLAAAKYIAARDELNSLLQLQVREAEAEANQVVWPYLTQLFGTRMPGKVTLPSDCGHDSITEYVTGLESLHVRNGEISGIVRTSSNDGRSHDTRSFFTQGAKVLFSEHVSL